MTVSPALLAGRYRLTEPLGSGGMGRVWLARDEVLRRDVAIKEVSLPTDLTPSEREELRVRTLREARTAARLSDPNVVQIYDVLRVDDRPWIVMEYIRSHSLQEIIARKGPVSPQRAAQIGLAVLGALVAAHSAGVLHRDVKPGNVLIADDGRVVLTDFGLATFDGAESSVTRPGLVWGSPEYVAPERAKHGTSSVEADMWSLGATLYAAVEGVSPYARTTAMATLTALATERPPVPLHAGPLKPVLTGLLRKDPRARLRPSEVERLLQRVAEPDGRPRRLPRQRVGPPGDVAETTPAREIESHLLPESDTEVLPGATRPPLPTEPPKRSGLGRRAWLIAITLVVAIAVVAAITIYAADRRSRDRDPSTGLNTAGPAAAPVARLSTVASSAPLPGEPGLPPYWTYYREPGQFRIAVPVGWHIDREGSSLTRFREPDSPKYLAVEVSLPPTGGALGAARDLDRRWADGQGPPGYRRIRLDPVLIGDGGAEWEYSFEDPKDGTMRVIKRWFVTDKRGFQISWTTREYDSGSRQTYFNLAVGSFKAQ